MESIDLDTLEMLVQRGRELQHILQETPQITSFLEALHDEKTASFVGIAKEDRLLEAGEVAKMLKTNTSTVNRMVKDGYLKPVIIPYSSNNKFWLSEVKQIPRRGG